MLAYAFHSKECPRKSFRQAAVSISAAPAVGEKSIRQAAISVSVAPAVGKKVTSKSGKSGSKRKVPVSVISSDSADDDYSPPKRPRPEPESPEHIFDEEGHEQVDETEAGESLVS